MSKSVRGKRMGLRERMPNCYGGYDDSDDTCDVCKVKEACDLRGRT
jgi:hypothetical protein